METYMPMYDSFKTQGSERYVPTSRFQVSSRVYLPAGEVDPRTGLLLPERQYRRRTQGLYLEREGLEREERRLLDAVARENAKGGYRVSMRFCIVVTALVLFFFGIVLLSQQGMIAERQKAINRLERSARDYRAQNVSLQEEIGKACDSNTICYAAARNLGMVPADTVEAVELVAQDTRPSPAQTARTATVQESGAWERASASVSTFSSD